MNYLKRTAKKIDGKLVVELTLWQVTPDWHIHEDDLTPVPRVRKREFFNREDDAVRRFEELVKERGFTEQMQQSA